MTPLHLGALHPVEQIVTIVLAFGPFVVLGIVIAVRRRADAREEANAVDPGPGSVAGVEVDEDVSG